MNFSAVCCEEEERFESMDEVLNEEKNWKE